MRKGVNAKGLIVAIFLLALNVGAAQAQTAPAGTQRITIQLLNGKTGQPLRWRALASVRIGSMITRRDLDPIDKRANLSGKAQVDVTNANPAQIEVGVNFISRDCRYAPQAQSAPVIYSIDDVRVKGIVSDNYCGGPKRSPEPGVLMIYVIPSTSRELWNE
jgi:hypothetical protein